MHPDGRLEARQWCQGCPSPKSPSCHVQQPWNPQCCVGRGESAGSGTQGLTRLYPPLKAQGLLGQGIDGETMGAWRDLEILGG